MSKNFSPLAAPSLQEWQVFHRGKAVHRLQSLDAQQAILFVAKTLSLPRAELRALPTAALRRRHQRLRRCLQRRGLSVACHEAGHAVIADRLGGCVSRVSIVPRLSFEEPEPTAGGADSLGRMSWGVPLRWDPRWKRGSQAALHHQALVGLAGPAAAFHFSGRPRWKRTRWSDDWHKASKLALAYAGKQRLVEPLLAFWKAEATDLVEENWPVIWTLAQRLREARELSGPELKQLLFGPAPVKKEICQPVARTALP